MGHDIRPRQVVSRRGTIVLGKMDIDAFVAMYKENIKAWQSQSEA